MPIVTHQSHAARKLLHEKYERRISASQADKKEAQSQGDLSENFGYVEAKKDVENYRRMQAELEFNTPGIQVIDPKEWTQLDMEGVPRVMVGAKVTIKRNQTQETVIIGGAWDSDLGNPKIIPYTSPLGKTLIPKRPGASVVLETSGETIEVLSVETPTEEDIQKFYAEPVSKNKTPSTKESKESKEQDTPSL